MDEKVQNITDMREAERRLKGRLSELGPKRTEEDGIDEGPCCVYGLVTRKLLEDLAKDVEEVKQRVNTVLWGMGAAVMVDVVMRLAGR